MARVGAESGMPRGDVRSPSPGAPSPHASHASPHVAASEAPTAIATAVEQQPPAPAAETDAAPPPPVAAEAPPVPVAAEAPPVPPAAEAPPVPSPNTQRRAQMLAAIERRGVPAEQKRRKQRRRGERRELSGLRDHLSSGRRDIHPGLPPDRKPPGPPRAPPPAPPVGWGRPPPPAAPPVGWAAPPLPAAPPVGDVDRPPPEAVAAQQRLLDAALLASAAEAAAPDADLERALAMSLRDEERPPDLERATALSLAAAAASGDADDADLERALAMSLADAGAPVKPEAPRPATPDAATAARVAQLLGFGFSREDAERGAARCSTADEAVLWLVEERARVDDCRAVDAARERSEADADAAKARRAALAKVDEEELAFGVGERAYRKRAALLEARDAAAVAVFGAPALRALLLDDAKPRARRELLRLLSLARDAVRWYPRHAMACLDRRLRALEGDEDALRREADRFSDALFKFSGGGVPAFFLGDAAAEPDDGEVELRPAPPRDAADVIDVT